MDMLAARANGRSEVPSLFRVSVCRLVGVKTRMQAAGPLGFAELLHVAFDVHILVESTYVPGHKRGMFPRAAESPV